MLKTNLLCLFAAVAFAQTDTGVSGGQRELMSGSGAMTKDGVGIRYRTVLTWTGVPPDNFGRFRGGGITVDANGIHRVMVDKRNESYFGYDLVIAGAGGTATGYLATFLPPTTIDPMIDPIASRP